MYAPETESDSRESLLLAARRLFADRGLDGTTVRDLAREADINLCMVSYHFGGKDGLYRACIERFGRERLVGAAGLLEPARTRDEFRFRLETFIRTLIETQVKEPEMMRILAREIEDGLPNSRDVFEETILVVFKKLVAFIQSAARAGIVRERVDALYVTSMIYCTIGNLVRWNQMNERYFKRSLSEKRNCELLARQLIDTVLAGVLSPCPGADEQESQ